MNLEDPETQRLLITVAGGLLSTLLGGLIVQITTVALARRAARQTLQAQREAAVKQVASTMQDHAVSYWILRKEVIHAAKKLRRQSGWPRKFWLRHDETIYESDRYRERLEDLHRKRSLVARSIWEAEFRLDPSSRLMSHIDVLAKVHRDCFLIMRIDQPQEHEESIRFFYKLLEQLPRFAAVEFNRK